MLKNFVKIFGGDPNKKTIEQYSGIAQEINSLEPKFEALSDEALRAKTDEFRKRIADAVGNLEGLDEKEQFKFQQDALNEILPEAFAAVREAAKRTIGQRQHAGNCGCPRHHNVPAAGAPEPDHDCQSDFTQRGCVSDHLRPAGWQSVRALRHRPNQRQFKTAVHSGLRHPMRVNRRSC